MQVLLVVWDLSAIPDGRVMVADIYTEVVFEIVHLVAICRE
jgi:hypothetical protein